MFYEALDLAGQGRRGEIGSGLWPLIALGASALFSVALLISSIKNQQGRALPRSLRRKPSPRKNGNGSPSP